MKITVEPKSVLTLLFCPKCIVFDLCSHIIISACPGEMAGPELSFAWRFHWVRGYIAWMSNIGGGGGALPPHPPSSYTPDHRDYPQY